MRFVWPRRPQFLHLGLFVAAYVLATGFAQLLAIVPGTGISIWPASGLFIATLILAPIRSWPWWVLGALLGEISGNVLWFHNSLPVALLIFAGNALEAAVGAWLVNRFRRAPVRLETLQEVLALVVLGAGVAPIISATVGSATLAWFGMQSFQTAWPLWWIGDATGVLIVAPLALVVFQNWRNSAELSPARWLEACVLLLIFLGVAALSLSGYLLFAYIIMPPLLWAAVRFEFKGAAVTLTLLALITAVFTISGTSQFAGDAESQGHRQVMLQLFLAISAASALIVAALARQHQLAMLTLRQKVEALHEREGELSQLVDMVPGLLWRLSPKGDPVFFSKRMIEFSGLDVGDYDKPDLSGVGAAIAALVHPDDAADLTKTLNRSLATGERFSMRYRLRRADGMYRWMESRAEPLRDESGRILQWYGLAHDIDDQVHAEEALRKREHELQQLIDTVPVQIWCVTPGGEPAYINKTMIDYIGLKLDDFDAKGGLASAIQTIVHPDDRDFLHGALRQSFTTGELFALRYRNRRWDGVFRWTEGHAEPLRDETGRIVRWYGVNVDIEDMVNAQELLKRSGRQLQQMIDTLPTLIWAATPEGEPSYLNRRLADYVGLTLSDLDTPNATRLQAAITGSVHPDDAAAVRAALIHSFGTGEAFAMKYRQRRADGVYRWTNGRAEPLRELDGCIVQWYGVSYDIDDEVRAQEELGRTRERLALSSQAATLAELSASIAHEVNQPLAAIVANSHACHRWLSAEPANIQRAKITAERIIRDANAAADVVSRIRALFKQSTELKSSTTFVRLIAEVRDLMAEEAKRRGIRFDVEIGDDLSPVSLDRVQIQQVLVNLVRNGLEAMESVAGERVLRLCARQEGGMVQTAISDVGTGVEFPDRIFEPFFTTKGQGMGMGLAICRSIIESHGGRLWAEKNEPHGATFIFTLPIQMEVA